MRESRVSVERVMKMVETKNLKIPMAEGKNDPKHKTMDEEVVEATPSKTSREVVEIPDEQAEDPKRSGKKKSRKKIAEEVEYDDKNGGKSMAEQDEAATEPKTALSEIKSAKKAKHRSKLAEKTNSEEVSADKLDEEKKQLDIVEEERKQLYYAEGNTKQLGKAEVEQRGLEEEEILGPKHLVKTGVEEKNGDEVEGEDKPTNAEIVEGGVEQKIIVEMNTDNGKPMKKKKLKEEKMRRDEEKMKIDQGISEIDRVGMGQDGAKENSHIVESKREKQEKRGKKRKNQNRQKEEGANKRSGEGQMVMGEKGAESKGVEGETIAKKQITYTSKEINNFVEMNTDSEKPMETRLKKSREFFQRCKEKKVRTDAEKMKIEQGISDIDKVEMGQEGAKENSHKVESKRGNEKTRGEKRKNQNRQKEEGANKSSGEGQMVNRVKGAESKGMEGETNAKKKQITYSSKEINNFVEMNIDNEKPMGKKLKKSSELFQRSKEKKEQRDAEKMKMELGIPEIVKGQMGQEAAKENSNIVESKRGNEKKRGKKRKNQNKEIEEGAIKSSRAGQMLHGGKGTESKGMEGEMGAKKKRTSSTNKEINNFEEMNIVNGKPVVKKPMGKKPKMEEPKVEEPMGRTLAKARKFFQRCKEKKRQRTAENKRL